MVNNTAIPVNTLRFCDNLDIMYMICYGITGIAVKNHKLGNIHENPELLP